MDKTKVIARSKHVLKRGARKSASIAYRLRVILIFVVVTLIFSYATNPFVRGNIVQKFFAVTNDGSGNIVLSSESSLFLANKRVFKDLGLLKSATHIVSNVYVGSKKTKSDDLESIIDEIHEVRFSPALPYLISGDHFSVFYPRSLGIFYATALDPRTARTEADWYNRQAIYLKTTAYALEVFSKSSGLATTVVPISPRTVTLNNIYAVPSDTLYSILYALDVLRDENVIPTLYPSATMPSVKLQTKLQSDKLLQEYKADLLRQYNTFKETVIDSKTGLIKKDILLSGAKDITKRSGAFYDNVVYWKTTQLAQKLGIIPKDEIYLANLKQKIIAAYWDERDGIFIEDLSEDAIKNHYYSSDWLIALMTGFLDPNDSKEKLYYIRSVDYIQKEKLDEPMGLKYQQTNRTEREYLAVRLFAPEYGGTAIWSNWGMEYIKLLAMLTKSTGDLRFVMRGRQQIDEYSKRMIQYRGYPEVYFPNGDMFSNLLYKSVRQTGWVVSYEQARMMTKDVEEHWKISEEK